MTQELEKELVEFYLAPNSAREIERKYGVNLYQLKKILAKYNYFIPGNDFQSANIFIFSLITLQNQPFALL